MNPVGSIDVTVVIAVRNGGATLALCLDSVLGQKGVEVAVVVVKGESTDNTDLVIDQYRPNLAVVINGADAGVYDAWNRSLDYIKSRWVCFMGCDDFFAYPDSLATLLKSASQDANDPNYVYSIVTLLGGESGSVATIGEPWDSAKKSFFHSMQVSHCGALHRVDLFTHHRFDTSYKVVGDYAFLLSNLNVLRFHFVPKILVIARTGGISSNDKYAIMQKLEFRQALRKQGYVVGLAWYLGFAKTLLSVSIKQTLRLLK